MVRRCFLDDDNVGVFAGSSSSLKRRKRSTGYGIGSTSLQPPRSLAVAAIIICTAASTTSFFSDAAAAAALTIQPGMGFRTKGGQEAERIVVFEYTEEYGTGGLVYNRPTPIRLEDLKIPKFAPFGKHRLYLGSGMTTDEDGDGSNIPVGDMAPWFWLHDDPNLSGTSTKMEGSVASAGGGDFLYMGGNLEDFSTNDHLIKFFTRYRKWGPGQLEEELLKGTLWTDLVALSPDEVLSDH